VSLLRITSVLAALAVCCPLTLAWTADDVVASARKLAEVAVFLPPAQREEVRRKALAIILLAEYGRLLPRDLSPGQWETVENIFLDGRFDETYRRKQADSLPDADTVSFDGGRLIGGGFSRIENLVGTHGIPIALDRRLPTRLVPLNPGEAEILQRAASAFHSLPEAAGIRERTDILYGARLNSQLADDGIFLRPYAGRADDLYYRLVQNDPSPASEMNFYAIVESLPARRYHPITGIGSPALVPSPWFSVSEILSEGGLLAVENFKSRSPRADVRNPFFGFASRVLPFLRPLLEKSRPGDELKVPKDIIRASLESPHRFSPPPVEPIFNDPSRFFGSLIPRLIRVSRRMTKAELAEEFRKIDFATPLPDVPGEPDINEVLVNPSTLTVDEFFQELPDLLDLDSTPESIPETDFFPESPEEVSPESVAPGIEEQMPAASTSIVLGQPLSTSETVQVVVGEPAPTPQPIAPMPLPMPLVAAIPSLRPAVVEVDRKAPRSTDSSATPTVAALPTPSPPMPIVIPADTDFSSGGISLVEAPPLLPVNQLSMNFPLLAATPAATEMTDLLPAISPLLAENITEDEVSSPQLPPAVEATPLAINATTEPILPEITSDETLASLPLEPSTEPVITSDEALASLSPEPILPEITSDETLASLSPEPSTEPVITSDEAPASLSPEPSTEPVPPVTPAPLPHAHYLAVVTPDIQASEKYLDDIAASDALLSKNAASLNRTNYYLQWLNAGLAPVEAYLDSSAGLPQLQKAELQAATNAVAAELTTLLENRRALVQERDLLLSERGRLRSLIEDEPLRLRTAQLDALLGRPVEAPPPLAKETLDNPKRLLKFCAEPPNLGLSRWPASTQFHTADSPSHTTGHGHLGPVLSKATLRRVDIRPKDALAFLRQDFPYALGGPTRFPCKNSISSGLPSHSEIAQQSFSMTRFQIPDRAFIHFDVIASEHSIPDQV
jgi:hypothetical protein